MQRDDVRAALSATEREDPGGASRASDRNSPRLVEHPWCCSGWDDGQLFETTTIVDEKPYVIRSEIKDTLGKVFQAADVAIPPALRPA